MLPQKTGLLTRVLWPMLRNWFAGYKHNIYNIIIILLLYTLSAAIAYTGVVLYTHAQNALDSETVMPEA